MTAEKLNHIENGIVSVSVLVIDITQVDDILTMNKTWQEIYNCYQNGGYAYGRQYYAGSQEADMMFYPILHLYEDDGEYVIIVRTSDDTAYYITSSPDGFPAYQAPEPG